MFETSIELISIILISILLIVIIIYGLVFLDSDLTLLVYRMFGKSAKSLRHKVIWIVGASSGIGQHLALQLAKSGSKIVISGTRQHKLEVSELLT